MPVRNEVQYRDFDITFRANPITGQLSILKNNAAVKRALRNLILTNRFERPFRPSFGSTVQESLFDNFDSLTVSNVKDAITRAIRDHEPRVQLLEVRVNASPDDNALQVTIYFRVQNQAEPDELSLVLERIR
jgi:phage baseplate assembly protein W